MSNPILGPLGPTTIVPNIEALEPAGETAPADDGIDASRPPGDAALPFSVELTPPGQGVSATGPGSSRRSEAMVLADLGSDFEIENFAEVVAAYEAEELSILPALEAYDDWITENLEGEGATPQQLERSQAIRRFIGGRLTAILEGARVDNDEPGRRFLYNDRLKRELNQTTPLLFTARTAQLWENDTDFAAAVTDWADGNSVAPYYIRRSTRRIDRWASSSETPRGIPGGLIGSPGFFAFDDDDNRLAASIVTWEEPRLAEFSNNPVRAFAFQTRSPIHDVHFLTPEDRAIEENAMVYYMASIGLQVAPYVGGPSSVAVDVRDLFSNRHATLQYLKEAGFVHPDYVLTKHWHDHLLAVVGIGATAVGLQGATRAGKLVKALERLGVENAGPKLQAAMARLTEAVDGSRVPPPGVRSGGGARGEDALDTTGFRQSQLDDLIDDADDLGVDLSRLKFDDMNRVFPQGGAYPYAFALVARISDDFIDLAKTDPDGARALVVALDSNSFGYDMVRSRILDDGVRGAADYFRSRVPRIEPHPSVDDFNVITRQPDSPASLPAIDIRVTHRRDHNAAFSAAADADHFMSSSMPALNYMRPEQIIDGAGAPLQDLDRVMVFSAHGTKGTLGDLPTPDAARMIADAIVEARRSGIAIDKVVLDACNQGNTIWVRGSTNGQIFSRELNQALAQRGEAPVTVFAANRPGSITSDYRADDGSEVVFNAL